MDSNENIVSVLSQENSKLHKHNKILSMQIAIAVEGLKALVENCSDFPLNIAQKTLSEMEDCEKSDLPQE
tara:strand:+ start:197 stop:406 length:210 start_codon:yes stop_codon:yes gene_type:complete